MSVYRNLPAGQDPELCRPFHDALLNANPRQLMWGSDWPFLRIQPTPDALRLLQMFKDWTADQHILQAVLVDNPNRLCE